MNGAFDDALERLRGTGSEVSGGVAPNHGPIAAEALVALGCGDVVVAWADRYRRKLDVIPPARSPVTPEDWEQALGAIDRFGDRADFFRVQLAEPPWRSCSKSGSAGCCRLRLPPAAMDSFARRTRCARQRTPRLRYAWKNSESRWPTGLPTIA